MTPVSSVAVVSEPATVMALELAWRVGTPRCCGGFVIAALADAPPRWGEQPVTYHLILLGNQSPNQVRVRVSSLDPSGKLLPNQYRMLGPALGGGTGNRSD